MIKHQYVSKQALSKSLRSTGIAGMAMTIRPDDCIRLANTLDHSETVEARLKKNQDEIAALKQQLGAKVDERLSDIWWKLMGKLFVLLVIVAILHYGTQS